MPTDEKQETEALYGSHAFQDLCQDNPTEHQVKERVADRISNSWGIPCRNVSASKTVGKKWKLGAEVSCNRDQLSFMRPFVYLWPGAVLNYPG